MSQPIRPDAAAPVRIRYFGDYEIDRELAWGGMGVVFLARQISLNRPVALKMILGGQLGPETWLVWFGPEAGGGGKPRSLTSACRSATAWKLGSQALRNTRAAGLGRFRSFRRSALRCDRPKHRTVALRASVGSTEAS